MLNALGTEKQNRVSAGGLDGLKERWTDERKRN